MRDARERLLDILEAIVNIERQTTGGKSVFDGDELIQVWCLHHIQLIGESARALPESARSRAPEIPGMQVIGMRHLLVHQYSGVDLEAVWQVVQRDVPELKRAVERLLGEG